MTVSVTRRHVLATAAAAAAAAWPRTSPAEGEAETVLAVATRVLEVDGRAATVLGVRQPDGRPGLETDVTRRFRVRMENRLTEPTLVHWHGLTPPYQQDGVPDISGPAVAPGGSAQYDFPLTFPGTFWMHSHQGLQEQRLLAAPLIVHGAMREDEQDVVVLVQDFSWRGPDEILDTLRRASATAMPAMAGIPARSPAGMAMDLNDVAFDAFLVNDRTLSDPEVVRVERGGRVRLRIINGAAASNFVIGLGGLTGELIAVDGHPVQPVPGTAFPVAVAQRLDIRLRLPPGAGAYPVLAVLEGEQARTGLVLATAGAPVGKLSPTADAAAPVLSLDLERRLRAGTSLAPRQVDRMHVVALTGSMTGYVWGLNGLEYGHDKPLLVGRGERVELVMRNTTPMAHPMHLHGHVFQVVAVDGVRFPGAVRDSVLVPARAEVTVAFDADNPGRWAFHCHNLYHQTAGMMTTLDYAA